MNFRVIEIIDFQKFMLHEKKWKNTFLKGVNLGHGKLTKFPGGFAITHDEYYKWFEQIKEIILFFIYFLRVLY